MRDRRLILAFTIFMGFLFLFPMPVAADPPGYTADQGTVTPGNYFALVRSGYSPSIWTYVWVSESYGDYFVHGESTSGGHSIDYLVVIKIKPEDTTLDYVELKVESDFYYGIKAAFWWWNYAEWYMQYVVVDFGDSRLPIIGWSEFRPSDGISGGEKNNKKYSTPDSWKKIYDDMWYRPGDYEPIDPDDWNYVGVWIRCTLSNSALFYRYTAPYGNAWYNPIKIHFRFF